MNVIIPEARLIEVFATLPAIPGYGNDPATTPKFEFGSHEDLLRFLQDQKDQREYPYPLVWLETPVKSNGGDQIRTFNCTLVLATMSISEMTNRQRLDTTIEYKLKPLLQNVLIALEDSGITRVLNRQDYGNEIFYNYGGNNNEETQGSDIWDAFRLECDLEINAGCIQTINYTFT